MMLKSIDGVVTYPYTDAMFRADNPYTSFPDDLRGHDFSSFGVHTAILVPPAPFDAKFKKFGDLTFTETTAGWEVSNLVVDLSAEELGHQMLAFIEQMKQNVQERLDDFAQTRNYDNILSACTYSTSTILKFHTEGQYCVDLRDQTWSAMYSIMERVNAGTLAMPDSWGDIEALLPTPTWPT